ncbi:type VII secretion integral membrane protein EccD [Actinomadura atramentaria]|uniref:type VII secretion integral membrane protein EccD n=1 Tax=Actinomadura atramentaria TaxID=1990 RepID=UPI00037908FE|nr:type VII secretion integral membrane protein EccD [Actinomadura atramentaria]
MSAPPGADLCRITLVGPKRRVDIALPADATFAELYPTMLHYAGQNLADAGLAHGGWVIQKLDEAPFDPSSTPQQAGVRDGDLLYLRPRMAQLPDLAFDDVPDVVATAVNDRPDRWRQDAARRFALGWGVGGLIAGVVILALTGPSVSTAAAAGLAAVLLLAGAVALSRALADVGAGVWVGYAAVPYAFLAGLYAPSTDERGAMLLNFFHGLGAVNCVAGFGAVVLVATIAGFAIADALPVFYGVAVAALLGTLDSAIPLGLDTDAAGVGAITLVIALALTPLLSGASMRMARVALPPVPSSADDLRRDTLMVDGRQVLKNTVRADRFVTGGVAATGLVAIGAFIPLAFHSGWLTLVTTAVFAVVLLLRGARFFTGRAQKLWLLVPGAIGLGLLAVGGCVHADSANKAVLLVLVPTLIVSGIVVGVGMWLPNHRPTPFWGRAGQILEIMLVVATIPLALGVAAVFDYVRSIAG